jgi:hypothetical protein
LAFTVYSSNLSHQEEGTLAGYKTPEVRQTQDTSMSLATIGVLDAARTACWASCFA